MRRPTPRVGVLPRPAGGGFGPPGPVQCPGLPARRRPATLHPGRRLPLAPVDELGVADALVVEVAAGSNEELAAVVARVPRDVVGGWILLAAWVRELDEEAGRGGHPITPSAG